MARGHRSGVHTSAISSRDNTRILGRSAQRAPLHRRDRRKPLAAVRRTIRPNLQRTYPLDNVPPALLTRHTRTIPSATRIPRPFVSHNTRRAPWSVRNTHPTFL
jgi:hypothetical protein